jgi:hypothetical protein
MKPQVTLDEKSHTYKVDGRTLVSVTETLEKCGLRTDFAKSQEALERGRCVHLACQYYDQGRLDVDSVDRADIDYVRAWILFLETTNFKIKEIEMPVLSLGHGYAGTPDRIGRFPSQPYDTMLEIKTGAVPAVAALQLAAYGNARTKGKKFGRVTVQLLPNGKYKLWAYSIRDYNRDVWDFFSALRIAEWRQRNGR